VDETEPELLSLDEELPLDEDESSLDDEPLLVEPESSLLDVPLSLDPESLLVDPESLLVDPESSLDVEYGSLDESLAVVVVVVAVLLVLLVDAIAGSSPAWTRNASTLNTATTLATAPAAKLRTPGTRRRFGTFFGAGSPFVMPAASTPALNLS
jgi:hypothetical protein